MSIKHKMSNIRARGQSRPRNFEDYKFSQIAPNTCRLELMIPIKDISLRVSDFVLAEGRKEHHFQWPEVALLPRPRSLYRIFSARLASFLSHVADNNHVLSLNAHGECI